MLGASWLPALAGLSRAPPSVQPSASRAARPASLSDPGFEVPPQFRPARTGPSPESVTMAAVLSAGRISRRSRAPRSVRSSRIAVSLFLCLDTDEGGPVERVLAAGDGAALGRGEGGRRVGSGDGERAV